MLACRVFVWGALSGQEQLPPFPAPMHKSAFACGIPKAASQCVVSYLSIEDFDNALPPVSSVQGSKFDPRLPHADRMLVAWPGLLTLATYGTDPTWSVQQSALSQAAITSSNLDKFAVAVYQAATVLLAID